MNTNELNGLSLFRYKRKQTFSNTDQNEWLDERLFSVKASFLQWPATLLT